jgi:hypothetical protein
VEPAMRCSAWFCRSHPGGTGMTDYHALRQAFAPDPLKLIVVAESPPEGGAYFYDDRNRGVLFREMMKLIGENPGNKIEGSRSNRATTSDVLRLRGPSRNTRSPPLTASPKISPRVRTALCGSPRGTPTTSDVSRLLASSLNTPPPQVTAFPAASPRVRTAPCGSPRVTPTTSDVSRALALSPNTRSPRAPPLPPASPQVRTAHCGSRS